MSFDLVVWKSDRPISPEEALATARELAVGGDAGVRPAEEIAAFAREVERRFGDPGIPPPGLGSSQAPDWSAAAARGREVIGEVTGFLAGRPVDQDPDAVMVRLAEELRGQFPEIETSRIYERPRGRPGL